MSAGVGSGAPHRARLTLDLVVREVWASPLRRLGLYEPRTEVNRGDFYIVAYDRMEHPRRTLVHHVDTAAYDAGIADPGAVIAAIERGIRDLAQVRNYPPPEAVAGDDEMEYMA